MGSHNDFTPLWLPFYILIHKMSAELTFSNLAMKVPILNLSIIITFYLYQLLELLNFNKWDEKLIQK